MQKRLKRRKAKFGKYQFFSAAADVAVFRLHHQSWEILLIQRLFPPFKNCWALPGGFIERNENAHQAARRELAEETGLKCRSLKEVGSFSDPKRDPRGRVLTVAFYTQYQKRLGSPVAGDDAGQTAWFPLKRLPRLAFDHREMILSAFEKIKK